MVRRVGGVVARSSHVFLECFLKQLLYASAAIVARVQTFGAQCLAESGKGIEMAGIRRKPTLENLSYACGRFVFLLLGKRRKLYGENGSYGLENTVVESELRFETCLRINLAECFAQFVGGYRRTAFFSHTLVHSVEDGVEFFKVRFKRRRYGVDFFECFYKAFHLNNKS